MVRGTSFFTRGPVRGSVKAAGVALALMLASSPFLGAAHASAVDRPEEGNEPAYTALLQRGNPDPLDADADPDARGEEGSLDDNGQGAETDPAPTPDPEGKEEVDPEDTEGLDGLEDPEEGTDEEVSVRPLNEAQPLQDATGCSYANAGTGAYAQSLCWFDLSGFTTEYRDRGIWQNPRYASILDPLTGPVTYTPSGATSAVVEGRRWGPIQNFPVSINLGGGYTLTATISTSASGSNTTQTNKARALEATGFPTWGTQTSADGAFLGRNNFYTGVSGKPAIYQPVDAGGGTSTATLSNIKLTDSDGQEVRNYSIVVADAESTDSNEELTWSTTGTGFIWLPNTPFPSPPVSKTQVMGNACATTATPAWNSSTPSANARCVSPSSKKEGTAMLHTAPPSNPNATFQVTQSMKGGGKQGVAFGVITARVEAGVEVVDRVIDANGQATADVFQVGATLAGSPLLDATTGSTGMQASDNRGLPIDAAGSQVAYGRAATGNTAGSYTETWVCTKTVPESSVPKRWPETGTSPTPPPPTDPFTRVKAGEYLGCTVTYTPPYLQLKKAVTNEGSYAPTPLPTPQNWNVTATGDAASNLPTVTGAGETTRTPVPIGDYALSETPGTGFLEAPGFELDAWSCPDAAVGGNGDQVTIERGDDVVCTVTNKTKPGSATWSKVAKGAPPGTLLKGAEWVLTGPGVPANTFVTDCVESGACGTGAFADLDPEPGGFALENLRWGTYTLKEIKAPAGYQVSSTIHTFTVGKDGTTFELDPDWGAIENVQQPVPSLPISGGIGTDQIYIATAVLLTLAGGAYAVKRASMRRLTGEVGKTAK